MKGYSRLKQSKNKRGGETMAYTPELSQRGNATLRRLAWHLGKAMSKSLEMLIEMTGMEMAELEPGEVCIKCKDNSICNQCPFNPKDQ
jgi:recombinational DNA repair protein RecR